MEITHNLRTDAVEIIPEGKFDISETEKFDSYLNKIALTSESKVIGINLQKIEYIDSSGLGCLIKALNAAKNKDKEFCIFGAQPKIQNIFQVARLEKFFSFTTPIEFKSKYPSSDDKELDSFIESL